jgi:hypothetical protein
MAVVPSDLSTLALYAQEVLDVAADSLDGTLGGIPDRVFRSPAAPAFDCCPEQSQLSVHVSRLAEAALEPTGRGDGEALRANLGSVIKATYAITVVRCAPSMDAFGNPPPPAEIQAVADVVEMDGWALWNGIRHAYTNGLIFEHCQGVNFDDGVPIAEQGQCVGWLFVIRAMIPGIPNPGITT